eukprot:882480-Amorphochlora_amoeboformis.AAC.1
MHHVMRSGMEWYSHDAQWYGMVEPRCAVVWYGIAMMRSGMVWYSHDAQWYGMWSFVSPALDSRQSSTCPSTVVA